jgi:hypothetical protein
LRVASNDLPVAIEEHRIITIMVGCIINPSKDYCVSLSVAEVTPVTAGIHNSLTLTLLSIRQGRILSLGS